MKKINSKSGNGLPGKPSKLKKMSKEVMEYELDHCPAPYNCPEACYKTCRGCFQDKAMVRC